MAGTKRIALPNAEFEAVERAYRSYVDTSEHETPLEAAETSRRLARLFQVLVGSVAGQSRGLASALLQASDALNAEAKEIEARVISGEEVRR